MYNDYYILKITNQDQLRNYTYINNLPEKYKDKPVVIEIPNTKSVSSSDIEKIRPDIKIRIAGAYDAERLEKYKNAHFRSESCKESYYDSVIYSRDETIKIIKEIEKIEKNINSNWSEMQKAIYVYDYLKKHIMYDPKFESRSSKEVRSLRGLITKKTVCAGYSIIYKEILDRLGIKCKYIRGNGHAWNLINIDNKIYPIDLTWDNTKFRGGEQETFDFFGQDIESFNKSHIPGSLEPFKNYQSHLSTIDPKVIRIMTNYFLGEKDFNTASFNRTRKDGSKYVVSQIGSREVNGKKVYKYYYRDRYSDNTLGDPYILYSETNVADLVNSKNFSKPIPNGFEDTVDNQLFSKRNIQKTLFSGSAYLGNVARSNQSVNKYDTVKKNDNIVIPNRRMIVTRSDGSKIILEKNNKTININGQELHYYFIFELVKEDGKIGLKGNRVATELDLSNVVNNVGLGDFLSRERIAERCKNYSGYIGTVRSGDKKVVYDSSLDDVFYSGKTINSNGNRIDKDKKRSIPTMTDMKNYLENYQIDTDYLEKYNKCRVIDNNFREIKDKEIESNVIFANAWLNAAGIKWYSGEKINGERAAFSEVSERLYNEIVKILTEQVKNNGVINPQELVTKLENFSYSHTKEILYRLFRNEYQTNLINDIFTKGVDTNKVSIITPQPLIQPTMAINF